MQTFLPYSDFNKSALVLDYRRLGKQRVECAQIINTLEGGSKGWYNHPAVRMWVGYVPCLKSYMDCMVEEWVRRGYRNSYALWEIDTPVEAPPWLGDEKFHASHRSALLYKNPEHYGQFGWTEEPGLPKTTYIWPVR